MAASDRPQTAWDSRDAARIFAERLIRVVPSLSSQALRMRFVGAQLQATTPAAAATALDELCVRARSGHGAAREVILAFTGLLQEPDLAAWIESLRHIAQQETLQALHQHLRSPGLTPRTLPSGAVTDDERRVPDYGRGRTLTLGERKAIARRPSRRMFDRLLADPHPSVIHNLLNNSVATEDDIVRLASKRPLRAEIMGEIARHPKWNIRRRVRMALVLNPGCPPQLGVPLVGLLMRPELETVMRLTTVHPEIRKAASERLHG